MPDTLEQLLDELRSARDELAQRVAERTEQLAEAVAALEREVRDRRLAEAQIKALFRRLVTVQEDERRRIARDLHDQIGQQLTALRINLEVLRTRSGASNFDEHAQRTQELAEEIDRSIDFLTWDLRPLALDQLGLAAGLEQLVMGWSERFGIEAVFESSGTDAVRLHPTIESNLYRVAQEALHNVFKHAGASHVAVMLHRAHDHTTLIVRDNGNGFDAANAAAAAGGLGLISMKERTTIAGGTLDIASTPGSGTIIVASVPRP